MRLGREGQDQAQYRLALTFLCQFTVIQSHPALVT